MFQQQRLSSSTGNKKQSQAPKSLPELVETFSRRPADTDLILEDCVIAIYDSDDFADCSRQASLLGATVSEQIMASFTTHVISKYQTPQLKNHLNLLSAKAVETVNKQLTLSGAGSTAQQIVGHSHTFKLVTKEWLEACLLKGCRMPEENYIPNVVQTNQSLSAEDVAKFRKQQYVVKRGLFKNMTFTLRDDAYDNSPVNPSNGMLITSFGEFENKEEIFEHMTRQIIENGGKVVPQQTKKSSHFIVTEDGQIPQIWELLGQGCQVLDELNRKIVHFRWIMQCIAKAQIMEDSDQMHLMPLPQRVPIEGLSQATIALTLFEKNDKDIFECLAKIYGFGRNPQEKMQPHLSTHIVVNQLDKIAMSATLRQLWNLKQTHQEKIKLPIIVKLDWLIDSMMRGTLMKPDEYLIDISKVKWVKS